MDFWPQTAGKPRTWMALHDSYDRRAERPNRPVDSNATATTTKGVVLISLKKGLLKTKRALKDK